MTDIVLIVDTESSALRAAEYVISQKFGYRVVTADSPQEAVHWVLSGRKPQPDVLLLDLAAPNPDALQLIRELKAKRPQTPIIALVSYGDEERTVQAVAAGVSDVLSKPVPMDRLKLSLRNVLALRRMHETIMRLERQISGHVGFDDIVGESAKMKEPLSRAKMAAASKLAVCIEGEAGTGKELLARAMHGGSERAGKPFVTVDCSRLPENSAEEMIFGFSVSQAGRSCKWREAEQGTLFFKHISKLSPPLQQRLLDMMDNPNAVQPRIMAASCQPLTPLVAAGHFSHRLLRRLSEMAIALPSLRERKDDIAPLARHFIIKHSAAENKHMIGISEDAGAHLANSHWRGNVTQLSNLIWRAMMICNQEILDIGNLRLVEQWQPVYYQDDAEHALADASSLIFDNKGHMKKLRAIEEDVIRLALKQNGGCMTRAAQSLGIGRSTLYRRIGDLDIEGYSSRANHAMRPMMTASSGDRS